MASIFHFSSHSCFFSKNDILVRCSLLAVLEWLFLRLCQQCCLLLVCCAVKVVESCGEKLGSCFTFQHYFLCQFFSWTPDIPTDLSFLTCLPDSGTRQSLEKLGWSVVLTPSPYNFVTSLKQFSLFLCVAVVSWNWDPSFCVMSNANKAVSVRAELSYVTGEACSPFE